jgi:tetratricopeptide (TPR) repeat protein
MTNSGSEAEKWLNSGLQLSHLAKYAEALKCYNKAIEIDPRHDVAWFNKGTILAKMQDVNGAIQCFNKAVEIFSKDADYFINLGMAYGTLRDYANELIAYQKALRLDCGENLGTLYFNLATCLRKLAMNKDALAYYTKAIEINPYDYEAYHNRAIVLIKLRKLKPALENLNKAIEISPNPDPSIQIKTIVEALLLPANKDKVTASLGYLDVILMDV